MRATVSQPNSIDDEPMMFDEASDDQSMAAEVMQPVKQYRKQGFSIYSLLLLFSFLFLTAASIIFFNFAG